MKEVISETNPEGTANFQQARMEGQTQAKASQWRAKVQTLGVEQSPVEFGQAWNTCQGISKDKAANKLGCNQPANRAGTQKAKWNGPFLQWDSSL